jgi:hypothetical protein
MMARIISAVTVIFGTAERIRSMRDRILATNGRGEGPEISPEG